MWLSLMLCEADPSDLISGLSYPSSGFSIFFKTRKYLCTSLVLSIKFGVSIFIGLEIWSAKYLPCSHTHIRADQFPKTSFLEIYINQVKTRYRKFWPKTILRLPNGSRVMEVKIKDLFILVFSHTISRNNWKIILKFYSFCKITNKG